MRCPTDDTTLQLADRHGIEIDYCPACRGVWLDRGELDKIVTRSAEERPTERGGPREAARGGDERAWRDDDDDRRGERGRGRTRRSFLDDLFDIGG